MSLKTGREVGGSRVSFLMILGSFGGRAIPTGQIASAKDFPPGIGNTKHYGVSDDLSAADHIDEHSMAKSAESRETARIDR
jgi:hypothetical protein